MRPARSAIGQKHLILARAIDRARQCGFMPEYQEGVLAAATAIAEDLVVPSEHTSFFIACGLVYAHKGD